MAKTKTDCRTDIGLAVALIDSIITAARVLRKMEDEKKISLNVPAKQPVREALKDLNQDPDVAHLYSCGMLHTLTGQLKRYGKSKTS